MLVDTADTDRDDLSELETIPELLGYMIAVSRAENWNEVEMVERLVRSIGFPRDELRRIRDVLRKLGYIAVATMLTQLARKARRSEPKLPPFRQRRTASALIYIERRRAEQSG